MTDSTANKGSLALAAKLSERGTQKALAVEWGIDQGMVSRWCSGKLRPGSGHRLALQEKYGIPWQDWDVATEQTDEGGAAPAAE